LGGILGRRVGMSRNRAGGILAPIVGASGRHFGGIFGRRVDMKRNRVGGMLGRIVGAAVGIVVGCSVGRLV
jgi:hypothetical protein